jgi:hypothetical protein
MAGNGETDSKHTEGIRKISILAEGSTSKFLGLKVGGIGGKI